MKVDSVFETMEFFHMHFYVSAILLKPSKEEMNKRGNDEKKRIQRVTFLIHNS